MRTVIKESSVLYTLETGGFGYGLTCSLAGDAYLIHGPFLAKLNWRLFM